MKTVTKVYKNTNVWVADENGDPVPGIEFYFTITDERGVQETIGIYYNCIDRIWFGIKIGYEERFDLDNKIVEYFVDKFNLKARIFDES